MLGRLTHTHLLEETNVEVLVLLQQVHEAGVLGQETHVLLDHREDDVPQRVVTRRSGLKDGVDGVDEGFGVALGVAGLLKPAGGELVKWWDKVLVGELVDGHDLGRLHHARAPGEVVEEVDQCVEGIGVLIEWNGARVGLLSHVSTSEGALKFEGTYAEFATQQLLEVIAL